MEIKKFKPGSIVKVNNKKNPFNNSVFLVTEDLILDDGKTFLLPLSKVEVKDVMGIERDFLDDFIKHMEDVKDLMNHVFATPKDVTKTDIYRLILGLMALIGGSHYLKDEIQELFGLTGLEEEIFDFIEQMEDEEE